MKVNRAIMKAFVILKKPSVVEVTPSPVDKGRFLFTIIYSVNDFPIIICSHIAREVASEFGVKQEDVKVDVYSIRVMANSKMQPSILRVDGWVTVNRKPNSVLVQP